MVSKVRIRRYWKIRPKQLPDELKKGQAWDKAKNPCKGESKASCGARKCNKEANAIKILTKTDIDEAVMKWGNQENDILDAI